MRFCNDIPFVIARHDGAEAISEIVTGLPRSRLPARRMTPAGEPSLGLLALKLQRRQAGRSLAMTGKEGLAMTNCEGPDKSDNYKIWRMPG